MPEDKTTRIRKPKARHRDTVMAAIEERLLMLYVDNGSSYECVLAHAKRIGELMDELKRSLGKDNGDE